MFRSLLAAIYEQVLTNSVVSFGTGTGADNLNCFSLQEQGKDVRRLLFFFILAHEREAFLH